MFREMLKTFLNHDALSDLVFAATAENPLYAPGQTVEYHNGDVALIEITGRRWSWKGGYRAWRYDGWLIDVTPEVNAYQKTGWSKAISDVPQSSIRTLEKEVISSVPSQLRATEFFESQGPRYDGRKYTPRQLEEKLSA